MFDFLIWMLVANFECWTLVADSEFRWVWILDASGRFSILDSGVWTLVADFEFWPLVAYQGFWILVADLDFSY